MSVAAHPGYSATNLQYVGPEMDQSAFNRLFWKFMNTVIAQSAEKGALPSLYAAAAPDVDGGDFIAPHGVMETRGYPVKSKSSEASYRLDDAIKLWQVSEELTDVKYIF